MRSILHDVPSKVLFRNAVPPTEADESATGPAVEFPGSEGAVFAVLLIGTTTGEASVAISFAQSHDGQTWVDVPNAEIEPQSEAGAFAVSFTRDRRFLRCQYDISGNAGATASMAVLVGQPRKIV